MKMKIENGLIFSLNPCIVAMPHIFDDHFGEVTYMVEIGSGIASSVYTVICLGCGGEFRHHLPTGFSHCEKHINLVENF